MNNSRQLPIESRDGAVAAYMAGLVLLAATIALGLYLSGARFGDLLVVGVLAGLAAFAERGTVQLSPTLQVSISVVPTIFAAVLFGPLAAMVVAAASMLPDLVADSDRPVLRWATYTASRSITAAAVGFVAQATEGVVGHPIAGIALATVVASVVAEVVDLTFAALTVHVRGRGSMLETLRGYTPLALVQVSAYAPIVAILAITYREISPWTLLFFLAPAIAAQRLYSMYQAQRRLAEDILKANRRLEDANLSFATALVATLDARDRYTAGHSTAVAAYARDIAERMGLPESDQRLAHLCGLVHDIGKIGLPPGLLEKRGPLNLRERRQMEQHSAIGERILAKMEEYAEVAVIVRHHHERVDGHGYPDGLCGEEIPLLSRIIAVADAYDAMTSDRPYRDAMPSRVARLRLAQAVEAQFDTAVVAAFEAILAGAGEDYRDGRHARQDVFEPQRSSVHASTS